MLLQRADIEVVVHEPGRSRAKLVVTVGHFIAKLNKVTIRLNQVNLKNLGSHIPVPRLSQPLTTALPKTKSVYSNASQPTCCNRTGKMPFARISQDKLPSGMWMQGWLSPSQGPYHSMDEAEDQRCSGRNRRCSKRM